MGVIHQQDCVPSFYDSSLHWFILNNKKPADFGAGREKMFWRAERKKKRGQRATGRRLLMDTYVAVGHIVCWMNNKMFSIQIEE